ncbi:hypothetical protein ACFQ08_07585 [Streptosporangium algeriense]|uniref:Uncharacterized protein n=1 Tax=Streptosporangium algeriense TaxID=1682748 RepID=A0ABW3DMK1_9ACTN
MLFSLLSAVALLFQTTAVVSEPPDPVAIEVNGASVVATLTASGAPARFSFEVAESQQIEFGFTANTLTDRAQVTVLDPVGRDVTSSGGSGLYLPAGYDRDLTLKASLIAGTYQMEIRPTGGATGAVTVTASTPLELGVLTTTSESPFTVTRPGQTATATFTGTAGDIVSLALSDNTFPETTDIKVFTPSNAIVVNYPVGAGSTNGTDILKLPQTGTYRVVFDPKQGASGSATATLSVPITGTLTSTGPGETVTIPRTGQIADFTFPVSGHFSLGVTDNTFAAPVRLMLFAGTGLGITSPVDIAAGQSIELDTVSPSASTYRVIVDPQRAGTGSLTLTLSHVGDAGTITTTDGGATLAIDRPGQDATFTFHGTAGTPVTIGFSDSTLTTASKVTVQGPANGVTGTIDGNTTELNIAKLSSTGTYRVIVDPVQPVTGTLRATLSTSLQGGTLDFMNPGTPVSIDRPGQNAEFVFTGTADTPISFGFAPNSLNQAARVTLYGPNGAQVPMLDSYLSPGTPGDIDIDRLPQTGAYRLVVEPERSGTGAMTVTLSDRVSGGPLTSGGPPASVRIGRPGQDSVYTFTATAGEGVRVPISGVTSFPEGALRVRVLRPDGGVLSNQVVTYDTSYDLQSLPMTGTYTVVADPTRAGTGETTVGVQPR